MLQLKFCCCSVQLQLPEISVGVNRCKVYFVQNLLVSADFNRVDKKEEKKIGVFQAFPEPQTYFSVGYRNKK